MIYSLFSIFAVGVASVFSATSPALRTNSNVDLTTVLPEFENFLNDFSENDLSSINDLLQNSDLMKNLDLESFDFNKIIEMLPTGDMKQIMDLLQNIDMTQMMQMAESYINENIAPELENNEDLILFNAAKKDLYSILEYIFNANIELLGQPEFITLFKQASNQFLSNPEIMNLLTSQSETFDMNSIMNAFNSLMINENNIELPTEKLMEMKNIMNIALEKFSTSEAIQKIATTKNIIPCIIQTAQHFMNNIPAMSNTKQFEKLVTNVQSMLPMLTNE